MEGSGVMGQTVTGRDFQSLSLLGVDPHFSRIKFCSLR